MMLVDTGSTSASPSLLDSPTLARVERARLRHEMPSYCPVRRHNSPQVVVSSHPPIRFFESLVPEREMHAIKKGLLWQQRERLFSRWKERYFILTRDYLHCFKRSSSSDKITNLGQFLFKIKLVEVDKVEWINKKSYSTVGITLQASRESRILLRATDGLEDWFELLEECTMTSKERRRALRRLWPADNASLSSNLQDWLQHRGTLRTESKLSDSVPDLERDDSDDHHSRDEELWRRPPASVLDQRLSLLTDIDINRCDANMQTPPPSVPSTFRGRPYKLNSDIFFMSTAATNELHTMNSRYGGGSITPSFCSSRSMLTPVGSFRSGHFFSPAASLSTTTQVKYRDRSQSDALHWKSRTAELKNRRSSYILQATHV